MHTIDTSVVIAARPQTVWQVLAELAAYKEWNLLVPLLGATLRRTEEGFHAMNRALRERADRYEGFDLS